LRGTAGEGGREGGGPGVPRCAALAILRLASAEKPDGAAGAWVRERGGPCDVRSARGLGAGSPRCRRRGRVTCGQLELLGRQSLWVLMARGGRQGGCSLHSTRLDRLRGRAPPITLGCSAGPSARRTLGLGVRCAHSRRRWALCCRGLAALLSKKSIAALEEQHL
jgi:hypothetical protein